MQLSEYGFSLLNFTTKAYSRVYGELIVPGFGEPMCLTKDGTNLVEIKENKSCYICNTMPALSPNMVYKWVIPKNKWHTELGRDKFLIKMLLKHLEDKQFIDVALALAVHLEEHGIRYEY